jgi:Flp pilus assembly pilin Flp
VHEGWNRVLRVVGQSGQTLAEYALLVSAVAVVVILAALLLGVDVTGLFSSTAGHV